MYNSKLHFHFVGIGGSGMSGLAELMLAQGFSVSGSDLKEGEVLDRIRAQGGTVFIGHRTENLPAAASLVVYSAAVDLDSNPEVLAAKGRHLPLVPRAEVLAELMRLKYGVAIAGSHGKTTTTSMTAAILEAGGLDPTTVVGGLVKDTRSGARPGKGKFLVAEACESDRSFLLFKPSIAVVTNVDEEHMQAYASVADLEGAFTQFACSVPFYGVAIICIDDARLRRLSTGFTRRFLTYGLSEDADLRAVDLNAHRMSMKFTVVYRGAELMQVTLPMPGAHMVTNSLAAIAVGLELGISPETIKGALESFPGVARRLEIVGEVYGVTVINDYGHHPAEIRATIRAIRTGFGGEMRKLIVAFQPHRYTRTRDCFVEFLDAFEEADTVFITSVYSAGEEVIEGATGEHLVRALHHKQAYYIEDLGELVTRISREAQPGDCVLTLGAGSIGGIAAKIVDALQRKGESA